MPKAAKPSSGKAMRHNPLADQIVDQEDLAGVRKTPRSKMKRKPGGDDEEEAAVLPSSVSRKVLQMAQEQKTTGDFDGDTAWIDEEIANTGASTGGAGSVAGDLDMSDVEVDEEGYIVMDAASEEEERALSLFLPGGGRSDSSTKPGQTLADVILQKIQEHEAKQTGGRPGAEAGQLNEALSPKVIQVYSDIGKWLKHYKSGKMPKAFKVIPNLVNWEEVLSLTQPLGWSPAAMYQAVSIFASNLNPKMAQRFFNLVLLPAVRQNIADHKRLNFHYYRSLRKAIYKPAAFFKGIVLPMCQEQCTLREAVVVSSVLAKSSIPGMHVAACLVRLSTMTPWYGTTSILLATLLNKKYALPMQVVDHLVAHFCAFGNDERELPVVWHRSLLVFVQRYKFDLSDDHRKRIKELLKVHYHDGIASEVRRELLVQHPGQIAAAADGGMDVS